MTATTVPQPGLGARSRNAALKVLAIVALVVVLTASAFALGHGSADDGTPAIVKDTSTESTFYVEPDPDTCNHTAHTPPC